MTLLKRCKLYYQTQKLIHNEVEQDMNYLLLLDDEDLDTVCKLGVAYGQRFYFGQPSPAKDLTFANQISGNLEK